MLRDIPISPWFPTCLFIFLIIFIFFRVKYVFVPIYILIYRFSPSKKFLQFLVPIKFSITALNPYFKLAFVVFNEIVQKCVEMYV